MQPHDFISSGRRLVSGDGIDPFCLKILDQLDTGRDEADDPVVRKIELTDRARDDHGRVASASAS